MPINFNPITPHYDSGILFFDKRKLLICIYENENKEFVYNVMCSSFIEKDKKGIPDCNFIAMDKVNNNFIYSYYVICDKQVAKEKAKKLIEKLISNNRINNISFLILIGVTIFSIVNMICIHYNSILFIVFQVFAVIFNILNTRKASIKRCIDFIENED
jgi:hypothetical protein